MWEIGAVKLMDGQKHAVVQQGFSDSNRHFLAVERGCSGLAFGIEGFGCIPQIWHKNAGFSFKPLSCVGTSFVRFVKAQLRAGSDPPLSRSKTVMPKLLKPKLSPT